MKLNVTNLHSAWAALSLSLPLNFIHAQGTLQWTATFDGSPPIAPGDDIAIAQYFDGNMWFRPIGPIAPGPPYHLVRSGGGRDGFAYNGTAHLTAGFGDSLAVSDLGGTHFGLVSVDLAEFSILYQTPLTVQFIAYKSDGSAVTTEFVTDGIIDSFGPLADYETFHFDSRFWDVVKVEVPTYGWSLDNMVFADAVPEPGAFGLFALGALLLGWRGLGRRR